MKSFQATQFRQKAARLLEESRTAPPELAPQLRRLATEYEQLADELDRLTGRERQEG